MIERIQADHDILKESMDAIEALVGRGDLGDGGAGTRAVLDLVAVLEGDVAVHLEMEQQHLYPCMRECIPGGAPIADELVAGDAALRAAVERLEEALSSLAVGEHDAQAAIVQSLGSILVSLRAHVTRISTDVIPRLIAALEAPDSP